PTSVRCGGIASRITNSQSFPPPAGGAASMATEPSRDLGPCGGFDRSAAIAVGTPAALTAPASSLLKLRLSIADLLLRFVRLPQMDQALIALIREPCFHGLLEERVDKA